MSIVDTDSFGIEGAGQILQTGSAVTNLKAGDRVMYFASGSSCLATHISMEAKICSKIPCNLSFEEAATVPVVYSTVIQAVIEMGECTYIFLKAVRY